MSACNCFSNGPDCCRNRSRVLYNNQIYQTNEHELNWSKTEEKKIYEVEEKFFSGELTPQQATQRISNIAMEED